MVKHFRIFGKAGAVQGHPRVVSKRAHNQAKDADASVVDIEDEHLEVYRGGVCGDKLRDIIANSEPREIEVCDFAVW